MSAVATRSRYSVPTNPFRSHISISNRGFADHVDCMIWTEHTGHSCTRWSKTEGQYENWAGNPNFSWIIATVDLVTSQMWVLERFGVRICGYRALCQD